jgi:archaellum component FlaC
MTENQEKELFTTLATLVTGVNKIQSDVRGLKTDVKEIKETLNEHSQILNEHSQILKRLDSKTDSIAEKVVNHEVRLSKAEKDIEELQGRVH